MNDNMLNLIFEILRQNKNICFVTGRGRKISKEILNKFSKKIIDKHNKNSKDSLEEDINSLDYPDDNKPF